jgi:hypothetical protein
MKKSRKKATVKKKKSAAQRAPKSAKQKPTPAVTSKGRGKGLVGKQSQVKQEAAVANAMFLYTDDSWSLRYFDPNDLHFKEREVFG